MNLKQLFKYMNIELTLIDENNSRITGADFKKET